MRVRGMTMAASRGWIHVSTRQRAKLLQPPLRMGRLYMLHKSADGRSSPFSWRTYPLSCDLGDGRSERGEAVQDGHPDLELSELTVEVPGGQALAQQFETMHPIVGGGKEIIWNGWNTLFWNGLSGTSKNCPDRAAGVESRGCSAGGA